MMSVCPFYTEGMSQWCIAFTSIYLKVLGMSAKLEQGYFT